MREKAPGNSGRRGKPGGMAPFSEIRLSKETGKKEGTPLSRDPRKRALLPFFPRRKGGEKRESVPVLFSFSDPPPQGAKGRERPPFSLRRLFKEDPLPGVFFPTTTLLRTVLSFSRPVHRPAFFSGQRFPLGCFFSPPTTSRLFLCRQKTVFPPCRMGRSFSEKLIPVPLFAMSPLFKKETFLRELFP